MSEKPTKTSSLIFLNSFKSQLATMVSEIENVVTKPESDTIVTCLANDFASIPFYFNKNIEDEYEWLTGFICFSFLINSKNSTINDNSFYINLINKWGSFDTERKNSYFSLISNQKSSFIIVNSIQNLVRLNSSNRLSNADLTTLIDKIESLIYKFANFIISIDKYISESETKKLNDLKNIFSNSKIIQIEIDYKVYLIDKFDDLGFDYHNNNLEIPSPEEIKKIILKNQENISKIDKNFILEFLKLQKFLINQKDLIYKSIEVLKLQNTTSSIDEWIDVIKNQIGSYNVVYLNSVTLIVCLCENELVDFYQLYENFDSLGVFKTSYEKEVLDSLSSIGSNINILNNNVVKKLALIEHRLKAISQGLNELNSTMKQNIKAINDLEDSIVTSFKSLEVSIGNNFNQLTNCISGHLSNIESGIAYNNLISTVNAYHLYKINKQTKLLLS